MPFRHQVFQLLRMMRSRPCLELLQPALRFSAAFDQDLRDPILAVKPPGHGVGRCLPIQELHEVIDLVDSGRHRSPVHAPVGEAVPAVKVGIPVMPPSPAEDIGLAFSFLFLEPEPGAGSDVGPRRGQIAMILSLAKYLHATHEGWLRRTGCARQQEKHQPHSHAFSTVEEH